MRFKGSIMVLGLMLVMGYSSQAEAGSMMGKTTLGLDVGGSFIPQEVDTDTDGSAGPIVGISGTYGLSDNLVVGLGISWETHTLEDTEAGSALGDIADVSTISILPTVQWYFGMSEKVSPYGLLGLGFNINSVSEDDGLNDAFDAATGCVGCSVSFDLDNTFAVKVGGGVDFAISDTLALNGELAWKLNSGGGDVEVTAPGIPTFSDTIDSNLSAISITVGVRLML
ncbi:MAG TPA: outer membrane beta-barrel protein [Nitrospiria bacterium]